MAISTDKDKIIELLTRGVEEIIDRKHLMERLESGKELRVKLGIDPTSPNLHLGRSIPLLKLRDFQELGHKVVFIVGDATGVIGDTSDKDSERPMLTREDVEKNLQSYKEQVGKILNLEKTEFRHNSEWLNKLSYEEIGEHANVFSVSEFISRDNIRRRLEAGTRVSLREVLYPLMQGYDSVAIEADVELGGTDQRFNLLAGRTLQSHFGQEPQDIIMNPLVAGTDGRKMSSSWGNTVNLTDEPNDMFGKIMSVPDDLIIPYFTYMTRVPMSEVEEYTQAMKEGGNPRDYKMLLGKAIVSFYHSADAADAAEAAFVNTFTNKQVPDEMPELSPASRNIVDVLVEAGFATSKGEARRAIDGNGVRINDDVVTSYDMEVKSGDVVNKGKRSFLRIR
ncbi:MAG: Tyrosyl-tRNA synthetase [Candidatus Magasanikbacteria bacterium GW2011_GWD2_43_18]|uniref:Tyrosine--tRNA ligase n=1 Tax=Candidatus Magasanikbacteria bacterium GW2011_GWE2_42_7 TaxID=1619052 RepID=A0A0G1EAR1_9BACT|nr:MAG: Tyrosyl-tRNA synthetase [Candidatus Magasanikbacteria bacterium GW2011_GWC2_42_27]KKS71673.1 MAG: Tyrosyl-tRNA synthetase [Candidatus Magasanikbacteria bacterium GW2011_GWE2_42_7]KKT05065.1 MAG: Tyrosyl-tRNA synthetase [Candidatus Magasanikbacteria bacterium GW2011_GWD2_43_18]HBB38129.1 tyrosine--tRNA ligase [Candidatus Magasanikbacteria bacterium]HCC13164.1 tyrosine--tRNA ligase [Candidatus Magasanikbacteria bacterium]